MTQEMYLVGSNTSNKGHVVKNTVPGLELHTTEQETWSMWRAQVIWDSTLPLDKKSGNNLRHCRECNIMWCKCCQFDWAMRDRNEWLISVSFECKWTYNIKTCKKECTSYIQPFVLPLCYLQFQLFPAFSFLYALLWFLPSSVVGFLWDPRKMG